jgi:hypothetical protein
MLQFLGIVGGLIALFSCIPYIKHIIDLKVKPHRVSFLIWSFLNVIALFSQLAKGASFSLWLPGLEAFGLFIIFLLSIKYGVGGFSKRDFIAICISIAGLIIWFFTKEAAFALYLVIIVDAVGLYLTLHKVYLHPKSETSSPWIIASFGSFITALSVGEINFILLSYPVYLMLANLSVPVIKEMRLKKII